MTGSRGQTSVVLVVAPFGSLIRPALGPSLLKAALARCGHQCRILYPAFQFAEEIGPDIYQYLAESSATHNLVGESVFSSLITSNGVDSGYASDEYIADDLNGTLVVARRAARNFVSRVASEILQLSPRIVGFSSTFQQHCASLAIAAEIKRSFQPPIVCFGGANCEGPMGQALLRAYDQVDFVFSGESDGSFPSFVDTVLEEKLNTTEARIRLPRFQHGVPVRDLDLLPTPDFLDYFDAVERTSFSDRVRPGIAFESSRGCWWGQKHHCLFCGLNGGSMAFRSKSAERILSEIKALSARWNVQRFCAADNIMDNKHLDSVFRHLERPKYNFRFFYEIKANATPEMLQVMARAGITYLQPGIESLDDDILQKMKKGVTALQNILLLRSCREIGIRPIWNIIYGFPFETPEQYRRMAQSAEMLQHLEPPNGLSQLRVDRFSPYYEKHEQLGFVSVEPVPAYDLVYKLPKEVIRELAYFFTGRRASGSNDFGYVDELRAVIDRWRQRSHDAPDPPRLTFVPLGPITLVEDTRDCAVAPIRPLTPEENEVLARFERPKSILAGLQRLAFAGERTARSIFEDLVDLRYIFVDGDKAISIVVDPTRQISEWEGPNEFPCGTLTAENCEEHLIEAKQDFGRQSIRPHWR